ncbi:redoxin family protein [Halobacteriovorax sp. GB3]|uniref:redoxin family protein n=1 Tax=Halobacteriovorax sp. GB3 TaxID=2719615 RepID=UPI0023611412|nr:redoxin family protein [Halobacteriovorax sp. GB3]MDD0851799.1 redoxin family protein [Halobacteriovorax sp. GB3]
MNVFIKIILLLGLVSCASTYDKNIPVNKDNIQPGSNVTLGGKDVSLYKGKHPLKVGSNFVDLMKTINFPFEFNNKVTVINVVPSIDTPVCEAQSHILGETDMLKKGIDLVSISRDLPMAQKRFAKEAKLTNIRYLSDYANGTFGRSTGVMMKEKELLARGVIVLDAKGYIRYMQFISEVTQLPDMVKAFEIANLLVK